MASVELRRFRASTGFRLRWPTEDGVWGLWGCFTPIYGEERDDDGCCGTPLRGSTISLKCAWGTPTFGGHASVVIGLQNRRLFYSVLRERITRNYGSRSRETMKIKCGSLRKGREEMGCLGCRLRETSVLAKRTPFQTSTRLADGDRLPPACWLGGCYSVDAPKSKGWLSMYKEFCGLQALPFNLTPDPEFLFLPPKHREAMAGLTYAILNRKGFVVLTGDAGTGKTTLLNSVLKELPETQVFTSVILNPTLDRGEFLENVLLDFGISEVPASKAQRLWTLQGILAQAHRDNKIVVLIVDEAHKLSVEVLEEIRLLGNYEFGPDKFLQILLLGQCELDEMLNRHELRQFKQRIALRLYIDPLRLEAIEPYIEFRWTKAGGKKPHPFTPEAIAGIATWSSGNPRLINSLCDTALLMAYGEGVHTVGESFVQAAATNLALPETPVARSIRAQVVAAVSLPDDDRARTGPETPDGRQNLTLSPDDDLGIPFMAGYGQSRANSSLLRRLAGKFGLPH